MKPELIVEGAGYTGEKTGAASGGVCVNEPGTKSQELVESRGMCCMC